MMLWPVEHVSSLFFQIGADLEKKWGHVFNWSEVHLYQSNFLQNAYFRNIYMILVIENSHWFFDFGT